MADLPAPMQVLQLASAKLVTKAMYTACKLRLPDLVAEGEISVENLAAKTRTHADSLYRLMRALASAGIFRETEDRHFAMTPMSELLVDAPHTVRGMVMWMNDPAHDRVWENLQYSVETGRAAFPKTHGMAVFDYFAKNRELSEIFNTAMTSNARNVHRAILDVYDFAPLKSLWDIGGGHGHLMAQILEKTPGLKGGVFDLPHVVEGAKAHRSARCEVIAGDFFREIPRGADAHIFTFILHDWSDEECARILEHSAKALPPHGVLLVVENIIKKGNAPAFGKLLDLEMLLMTTGRERTLDEFKALFKRGGFELTRVLPTKAPATLLEARKH